MHHIVTKKIYQVSSWWGMKIGLRADGGIWHRWVNDSNSSNWMTEQWGSWWSASVLRAILWFLFIRCFPVLPFFPFRLCLCVYYSSISFPPHLFSPSVWLTVVCAAVLFRHFVFVCLFPAVFAFTAFPLPFGTICGTAVWLWPFSPLLRFLFFLLSLRGFLGLLLFLSRRFVLAVSSVFCIICLSGLKKKYNLQTSTNIYIYI